MARRGRKAKARQAGQLTAAEQAKIGRALGNFFNARARSPRSMGNAEMRARQAEAAALLGTDAPGRSRRRRRGFIGRTVNVITTRAKSVGKSFRRRTMPRGRKGNSGQKTYAQVTGGLPIQMAMQVTEALFALGSFGIDVYTAGTKSTSDDTAFPIAEYAVSSLGRWASQKYFSRKAPELAAVLAHGFSAANGDRVGDMFRTRFARFLKPAV